MTTKEEKTIKIWQITSEALRYYSNTLQLAIYLKKTDCTGLLLQSRFKYMNKPIKILKKELEDVEEVISTVYKNIDCSRCGEMSTTLEEYLDKFLYCPYCGNKF